MISPTKHHGWKALSFNTGRVEFIIPLDVGPRVISCSLDGGPNLFATVAAELGKSGEKSWKIRGGHRLWHAPEAPSRSYQLDNGPITATKLPGGQGLRLDQPLEEKTGIRKSVTIEALSPTDFKITHILKNENLWTVELSPWALTVMGRESYTAIPLNPKIPHGQALLPDYALVPWTYTDFTDPVWDFHRDYIGIRVDRGSRTAKARADELPWLGGQLAAGRHFREIFCGQSRRDLSRPRLRVRDLRLRFHERAGVARPAPKSRTGRDGNAGGILGPVQRPAQAGSGRGLCPQIPARH